MRSANLALISFLLFYIGVADAKFLRRAVESCNTNDECIPLGRCKSACELLWSARRSGRLRFQALRRKLCYVKKDGTYCVKCDKDDHLDIEYCSQDDDPEEIIHARSALKRLRKDYPSCGNEYEADYGFRLSKFQVENPSRYPWTGVLKSQNDSFAEDMETCGTVLLTKRHAITAGHCVADKHDIYTVTFSTENFNMKNCINSRECFKGDCQGYIDTRCITYNVIEIILHPKYERKIFDINFDIAVLTLDKDVQLNPVCLPDIDVVSNIDTKQSLTIPAWNLDFNQEERFEFGFGDFRLAEPARCRERFSQALLHVDIKLCIVTPPETSRKSYVCYGDSGTGVVRVKGNSNAMELVGLTSYGSQECEKYSSAVFTGITGPVLRWILNQLYLHKIQFHD